MPDGSIALDIDAAKPSFDIDTAEGKRAALEVVWEEPVTWADLKWLFKRAVLETGDKTAEKLHWLTVNIVSGEPEDYVI